MKPKECKRGSKVDGRKANNIVMIHSKVSREDQANHPNLKKEF